LLTFEELGYAVDHVADGAQALRGFVWNIDIEFSFDGEKDIYTVERVDAEFLKSAIGGNFVLGKMLGSGDYALTRAVNSS
jgi:hypothetical protein